MHNDRGWTSADKPYEVLFYQRVEVLPEVVPNRKLTTGATQDRPFAPNTGGSKNFRIPSLITHKDGSLLAAIDARWNHVGDAAGLDTIFSRSTDGGKTWSFNFPNYFPDSVDAFSSEATAFIDPVMAQKGDTTYMMVDLWPGGVALNTAKHQDPVNGSGYVQIDGASASCSLLRRCRASSARWVPSRARDIRTMWAISPPTVSRPSTGRMGARSSGMSTGTTTSMIRIKTRSIASSLAAPPSCSKTCFSTRRNST